MIDWVSYFYAKDKFVYPHCDVKHGFAIYPQDNGEDEVWCPGA